MSFEEREMASSSVPWLGDEVEEYLSYFTEVQRQYLRRWIWKGRENSKKNEQFLQGKDWRQAKSLQSMAYRIKGMVLEQWREGKMVPREVYAALNSIVPIAKGDRLYFEGKRVGRRGEVPMRSWREVQVQAPAPISTPTPGQYTMEQALAAINGEGRERELNAIAKSLDGVPNAIAAGGEGSPAFNSMPQVPGGFDVNAALAQHRAKPRDPSLSSFQQMIEDSRPTSEFPVLGDGEEEVGGE